MSAAVHHLNCMTIAPLPALGGRVVPARMVAHCLLVEYAEGLTLVDTGIGRADIAAPARRLGREFVLGMRPSLDPAETAAAQVRALGHDPADVRDIVLTHLDLDHAGGIGDFPGARVHVLADELDAARRRESLLERARYVPAQWSGATWVEHRTGGEEWLGFSSVTVVGEDVLLVPLRGHTRGHCGVAVRRPGGGWFLHAGDGYFFRDELRTPPRCPAGLRAFQAVMQADGRARHANQDRLRALDAEHGPGSGSTEPVHVFSAHDATEFDALAGTTD